ncbi:short-chain dehydrogenase [Hysterangium stoloniferum]|nr:short-chain dehydrogenase [Hysterangium stoloniferum]
MHSSLQASQLFDVSGFVAIVTGGGTGIGLMIARGLASNGACVYITGRRKDVLDKVVEESNAMGFSGSISSFVADVTDKQSILVLVEEIEKKEGRLHILINNAGQVGPVARFFSNPDAPECKDTSTLGRALFDCQDFAGWADHFSINVSSNFFVSTAFLGLLEKASKETPDYTATIINITSISGLMRLSQNHFAYNSGKAAASHLSKMLATELARRDIPIRVNAIAPGAWPSEMTQNQGKTLSGAVANRIAQPLLKIPANRGGTEEEMVATVLYLASRAGGYMTGQELIIDGGYFTVNPSA